MYNLLIQPFHLLIYTILVGSAIELATVSLVYAVVAIYFLMPAEKLLRKFFGFDNAGTLSAAGSFAGGALFSAMIGKLSRPKPPAPKDEDKTPKRRKPTKGDGYVDADTLLGGAGDTSSISGPDLSGGLSGRLRWFRRSRRTWRIAEAGTDNGSGGRRRIWRATEAGTGIGAGYGDGYTLEDLTRSALPKGRRGLLKGTSIGQRIASAGRSGLYTAQRQLANKAKTLPKAMGRKLRRVAVGSLGAGTAGLLALGAGASMDPGKAAALVMGATSAGYGFTNYYGDKLAKSAGDVAGSMRTGFWGTDLKAIEQSKFDKEFVKSADTVNALTKALGSQGARNAIDNGYVQAMLNNDITDPTKVSKALKLVDKYQKAGMDEAEALARGIAMAKWNRDINPGVYQSMSREHVAFKNNLTKKIMAAEGISASDASSKVDQILADLITFEQ